MTGVMDECGEVHNTTLKVGQKYKIWAHDCCLEINELVGTFIGWLPSDDGSILHDLLNFEEGFTIGPYWVALDVEEYND